ncbi:hypothetical protein NL108_000803 [Boleophthalmus pectinirostris]|nr:hypothetical protein NL108_000803 [Boleophthalmus pectinirostris]
MASKGKLDKTELLEVDICDDSGLCFEESGFVNSPCASRDVFEDFQQWTGPTSFSSNTSAIQEQQKVLPGAASGNARPETSGSDCDGEGPEISGASRASIVDCLLVELYDTYSGGSRRQDSWDSSTEASGSEAFMCRSNPASSLLQELQEKHTRRHQRNYLAQKDLEELRSMIQEVKYRSSLQSAKLIRQLKRRDRLCHKLQKNYDIITACLQAVSQKRRKKICTLRSSCKES